MSDALREYVSKRRYLIVCFDHILTHFDREMFQAARPDVTIYSIVKDPRVVRFIIAYSPAAIFFKVFLNLKCAGFIFVPEQSGVPWPVAGSAHESLGKAMDRDNKQIRVFVRQCVQGCA